MKEIIMLMIGFLPICPSSKLENKKNMPLPFTQAEVFKDAGTRNHTRLIYKKVPTSWKKKL